MSESVGLSIGKTVKALPVPRGISYPTLIHKDDSMTRTVLGKDLGKIRNAKD